jgi:hypothetical protein
MEEGKTNQLLQLRRRYHSHRLVIPKLAASQCNAHSPLPCICGVACGNADMPITQRSGQADSTLVAESAPDLNPGLTPAQRYEGGGGGCCAVLC